MWSTGEGNGKPLQYSYLENPMNSMKRQNDRILKEELPRSGDWVACKIFTLSSIFPSSLIFDKQSSPSVSIIVLATLAPIPGNKLLDR